MMTEEQQAVIEKMREYLREQLANASKEKSEQMAVLYFIHTTGTEIINTNPEKGHSTVRVTGDESDKLVEMADDDPCAWEAACRLAGVLLQENKLNNEALRGFAGNVLTGKSQKPKKKSAWGNISRDFPIALSIFLLERDAGIHPYKNDETEHCDNGIDIIAGLVTSLGYSLTQRNAKNVWERWGDHVRAVKRGTFRAPGERGRPSGPYYFQSEGEELLFRKSHVPKKG